MAKKFLQMIYYGSSDICTPVSSSLMFQINFFVSLREDVPHREKLAKMAKIKVCKSSCIFRNMYGGDTLMTPPCPLSAKLAKIMIYHVVKMGFMK